jgi:hypothetical protein
MENIVIRNGEEEKKLKFVYKSIISNELTDYLKPKLQFFVWHNFVARRKDKLFKSCLENFQNNTVVSIVYFIENHNFEVQNKM